MLLYLAALRAASPQAAPEVTQRQAPATFTSRVNLVSVPVVVRDSKGRAVGDLKVEDFRLFDKGRQQVIVKFSIQRNGVAPGEAPAAAATVGASATSAAGQPAAPESAPLLPTHYVA